MAYTWDKRRIRAGIEMRIQEIRYDGAVPHIMPESQRLAPYAAEENTGTRDLQGMPTLLWLMNGP